jgi:hypothetical protein
MTVSPDGGWVRVSARREIGDGDLREVDLGDGVFALLAGAEGRVFACAANCSHQDSPLCEGALDGRILTCPAPFSGDGTSQTDRRASCFPAFRWRSPRHSWRRARSHCSVHFSVASSSQRL